MPWINLKTKDYLTFSSESFQLMFDLASGFVKGFGGQVATVFLGAVNNVGNLILAGHTAHSTNKKLKELSQKNHQEFGIETQTFSVAATTGAVLNSLGNAAGVIYLGINAYHYDKEHVPSSIESVRDGAFIASYSLKQVGKTFEREGERQLEYEQKNYDARKENAWKTANSKLSAENKKILGYNQGFSRENKRLEGELADTKRELSQLKSRPGYYYN